MSAVVLIGAGASFGSVRAPLAKNFGQYVSCSSFHKDWANRYGELKAALDKYFLYQPHAGDVGNWGLDGFWSFFDNHSKLHYLLDDDLGFKASVQLHQLIAEVYGPALPNANATRGTLLDIIQKYIQGRSDVAVVSMNYDTVFERLAQDLGVTLVQTQRPGDAGRNVSTLIKPHGSLSWKRYIPETGRQVEFLSAPMASTDVRWESKGDLIIQPVIVAPVPFKSEILAWEIQVVYDSRDFFTLLSHQWRAFRGALRRAERLVVVGYGFPPEDSHAEMLMRSAFVAPRLSKLTEVVIYDICFEQVAEKVKKIVGDSVSMISAGKVDP